MKIYFTWFMLCLNISASLGQVFTITDYNKSMTIVPQGIRSTIPALSDVTNVSLGEFSFYSITSGTKNIAIGHRTLYFNTSGSQLTAVGYRALSSNSTGVLNSAFGRGALHNNKTGNENTAFGGNTLESNISLSRNVAIGQNALREQDYDGGNNSDNVAVGEQALMHNNPTDATNGRQNIAIGGNALYKNQTGARNIALAYSAAYAMLTGNDNVVLGTSALVLNTAGSQNTAIGSEALKKNLGSGNIALGDKAGINETGDNKLYIIPIDDDIPLIGGDFTNKKVGIARNIVSTANPNDFKNRNEILQVEGEAFKTVGNGSWVFPSDRRLKKNILLLNTQEMLQKVLQMQGVSYEMKDENNKGIQYGFIAQELREIFPSKVKENLSGYLSADYGSYDPMIVESIKALNKKIMLLRKDKTELETAFKTLNTELNTLLTKVSQLETVKAEPAKSTNITEK
ncbi:tail fiber domain-containing protein [Emticicia sp. C21]|uniref:tail fiber domain-containing protein n=1 Tax=Emticicia sp. C21 TaxID=2302915 RepID=UPI000E34F5EC|nr:tail fiber domain-containing protein [Emticicia sp. C21]RFS16066.1 hypothetical protein D0T08_14345 [Emticicia sp. C21]